MVRLILEITLPAGLPGSAQDKLLRPALNAKNPQLSLRVLAPSAGLPDESGSYSPATLWLIPHVRDANQLS